MAMFSRSTKPRRAPYRRPRPVRQPRVEALEERLALSGGTALAFEFQHPVAIGKTNPGPGAVTPAAAVDKGSGASLIASPDSQDHGKTLAKWQTIYFRWYFSQSPFGADRTHSKVGHVQLMPHRHQV